MEPEFLEQFETVNNAASAAPASDFRTAEFHGENAVTLEAHVADLDIFAYELLLR